MAEIVCRSCRGSTKCQTCGGTGTDYKANPHPAPWAINEDERPTCFHCGGSGDCIQCDGTGYEDDED